MKASETSERYVGKVRECCNYSVRSAKKFLDTADIDQRQAGGTGVEELKSVLKEDLSTFTDEIIENPFSTDQKAYAASNLINFVFMLIAVALAVGAYFLFNYYELLIIVSLLFAVLALVAFFGGFGFTSKNMMCSNLFAKRYPTLEPKKRVILTANLDAPHKRNVARGAEKALKFLTFFGILLIIAFNVVELLILKGILNFNGDQYIMYAAFALVVFLIFPLILMRTVSINTSTPGVADNLIGSYTACGVLRYMSEFDLRLQETELCVLLTDAKENKNSGAKNFCKEFEEDLNALDTTVLCLDSIYDVESFNIQAKGRKLNKLVDLALENAEVMATDQNPKYHLKKSDMKSFTKAGLDTALITTLTDDVPDFYRNADDTQDNLNVRAVEAAIKFCLEFAYAKDEQ